MVSPNSTPAADPEQVLQQLQGSGDKENESKENVIDIDTVQQRLEDLLSKQSLAEDTFIQQHMNAQMYIPLSILLRHHSFQVLGDEAAVLPTAKAAALRSEKVGLDEDGAAVRPLLKPRRNTLILRDLPENVEDELKALFDSSPESDNLCSLKPDVNNTAFASFKTDEAAQNAALWLRSQKVQGAEIKCAVKSEHFVRSFFPASPGPGMQAQSPYMMPHQAWGYPSWMGGWSPAGGEMYADPSMGWGDHVGTWNEGSPTAMQWDGKGDGKGKKGKGKGKSRMRGSLGGSFSQDSQMESGSDFSSPMLPPSQMALDQQPDTEGLAEPGYTHEYRKYSRQYIIEICSNMDDIVKPESYEKCEKNQVALFRQEPNKDWAPLPTPVTTFASNFFDNDRRGKSGDEQDGEGQPGKGEGRSRKASWGPQGGQRASQSESRDCEESDWAHSDAWWTSGKGGDAKRRSSSKSWDQSKGWVSDAGYGQTGEKQWVKKGEAKPEQEANDRDDNSAPRKPSWADKVKGTDSPDHPKRWVAKAKAGDDSKSDEKESADADTASAAPACGGKEALASEPTKEGAAATPASPSWADKVRAAASK